MIRPSGLELFKMRGFQNTRGRAWRMGLFLAVSVERIQHYQTAIHHSSKVSLVNFGRKCIGKQRAELNPNVTEMAKSMKSLDEKNSIKYEQKMSQKRDECPQRNWSSIRHILGKIAVI